MSLETALIAQLDAGKDDHVSQSTRPHASASMALQCARAVGYKVASMAEEGPATLKRSLAFALGTFVHTHVQSALERLYADFRAEVRWDHGAVTGRADGLYSDADGAVVVEIKTVSTKGATRALSFGPSDEHIMQAALSAAAFGASRTHLIYVAKADVDPPLQEWVRPVELAAAIAEERRLARIADAVVAGERIPRRRRGVVMDPHTTRYPCAWCGFRERCLAEGE